MKTLSKIIVVALFVISILIYQLWSYLLNCCDVKIFYPGISLMFVGFTYVIYYETKTKFKVFLELFMWMAINNFLDELFFDPSKVNNHEYIVFLIIFLNFTYKWRATIKN